MSEQVVLPALGESVTEGTVTRWLKKVGDTVAVDEPLVEVSTDKVDTEIPSPVAGVIEQILVQEDETVQVGAVLVVIGSGSGAAAPAAAPVAEAPVAPAPIAETPAPVAAPESPAAPLAAPVSAPVSAPVAPPVAAPVAPVAAPSTPTTSPTPTNVDAGYVTPLVRKLASEIGIDLSKIAGTGVGGRIRKDDVLAASSAPAAAPIAFAAPVAASAPATTFVPGAASPLRGTTEPMSRLRKVLAERAVASMVSTAQLTTVVEVDVTKIAALRSRVQAQFVAATGGKLNFMPFFALAAAEALRVHPKLNATIDGENIVYHGTENISFAVDTEKGLLTPVIRDAATLNIAQIAKQIADLAARTRASQLKPDELGGGTFTLTNTGSRGALFDTPVVFLPQVAILGTGVVTKRPVVVTDANGQDSISIRSMVYLALSYDHRLVDGADASRFLVDVKSRLEEANFDGVLGI
ncbi:2-oxoglutarate dehydrogenase, E2 component, dihydrolipoamide succinyltransferase [Rhodoluna lacicola]|uniref:2-oxoglutarate dehydrogenase, E2 component, dihydrolipoamide succinyltransferase n=1 Tax=Rhodoluna lacicola TaxID=529884 RepID=UPI0022326D4F|nr:2-oxoglutarate dehydrogenase, E2 component, dihydrolipoamide succinyltransferase [Rhodoluna lacicola]BDS50379.1 dihydrolipoamide acetyltransferase component of pyruvate dehydrogenase complex [Rhodoluna lacicola]